ncbi:MAG: hypothetical protein EOP82_04155 [Variovorax sp.]|nr:MAG: hypothetical protein EOP82_04155 [Variovorax sp.]
MSVVRIPSRLTSFPQNYRAHMMRRTLAAVLAMGSAAVVKLSEDVWLCALKLSELAMRAVMTK